MDSRIKDRLDAKIAESLESADEIKRLAGALAPSLDAGAVSLGILAGRLYNSFYYQSHRVLKRDPYPDEFLEFVGIMEEHRERFLKVLKG